MRAIVFWLNMPSIHQAPLIRDLARLHTGPVVVVTEAADVGSRAEMGWSVPDFGEAVVYRGPDPNRISSLLSKWGRGSFNLVSGLGASPFLATITRQLIDWDEFVVFQSERWDDRGILGLVRPWVYRSKVSRLVDNPKVGLLAMGSSGVSAFQRVGFPRPRIAEFAYFVDPDLGIQDSRHRNGAVFVGAMISRKRPDLAVRAFANHPFAEKLTLIGGGELRTSLQKDKAGARNIEFRSPLPNEEVQRVISQFRMLVLPSQFDGWGAVVNEALLAGTPVVCSDGAGASALLQGEGPFRGEVFKKGSLKSLTEAATLVSEQFRGDLARHNELRRWATSEISPSRGAERLTNLLYRAGSLGRIDWS